MTTSYRNIWAILITILKTDINNFIIIIVIHSYAAICSVSTIFIFLLYSYAASSRHRCTKFAFKYSAIGCNIIQGNVIQSRTIPVDGTL